MSLINQKLVEYLKNESTLLTPTRRLAGRLLTEVNAHFAKYQKAWPTPRIYALEDWFKALWHQFEIEGQVAGECLNVMQSLLRWEEIIQSSEKGKILFQPHLTAKMAFSAWKMCHQWLALSLLDEKIDNIEVQTFQEWAKTYQCWLVEQQFIDEVQLPSEILKKLQIIPFDKKLYCSAQKKLVLFGFEEFSPFLTYFFETLIKNRWHIHYIDPQPILPTVVEKKNFINEIEEWKAAARWAQKKLVQKAGTIAIVTPHLTSQRNQIEEVFNDCLMPLHICHPAARINPYFNISTAIPLIQYPIIQAALDFLKLGLCALSRKEYIDILTSPFSKGSTIESIQRSEYAVWLKSQRLIQIDEQYLQGDPEKRPPIWRVLVQDLICLLKTFPKSCTFSEWSEHIQTFLTCLGWPGERPLNSIEHQAVKRWNDFLNEFHQCDSVLASVNFSKVLHHLQKLIANIPFQAENKGAPIQILGILEAAGQHFDHIWVMGIHSQAWPPMAMPNPFLPLDYQRRHDMPHASPERELVYAQKVTKRLQESAKEIIFSYPLQENERALEQSELIRDIPLNDLKEDVFEDVRCIETYFSEHTVLEKWIDNQAPIIQENEKIHFNTNTLILQAACPFKAFAQIRLNAKEPESEEIWLNPQQQGTLIHRILDDFWKIYRNQKTLLAESEENLEKKLQELIARHLKKIILKDAPIPYIEVEKKRLYRLLKNYLMIEKERAPFEIVELESQKSVNLAGMHFTLRLDRIDKNMEGDYYIIDYKTGQFKLANLWGARPSMPQLPLYYLSTIDLNPKAIFVTKINSQECGSEGISQNDFNIPGVKPLDSVRDTISLDWTDLKSYWSTHLNSLAKAFQEGQAQVSPLDRNTCARCHLNAVCRIGELA